MAKKWIKGAIKHPGALRAAAKKHGAIKKSGKINLTKMQKIADKSDSTKLKRRVALAKTLKKMHH